MATDVNTVTTPPAAPNTYTIVAAFSGSYNVGTDQTYTSLTNAGGIFEAINAGALTGNVTINITSDLTGELGTNALNQWAEDGAGGYTMLIQPSGAARIVTGSNTGALIRFYGADRVTIDGSTTGATATGGRWKRGDPRADDPEHQRRHLGRRDGCHDGEPTGPSGTTPPERQLPRPGSDDDAGRPRARRKYPRNRRDRQRREPGRELLDQARDLRPLSAGPSAANPNPAPSSR